MNTTDNDSVNNSKAILDVFPEFYNDALKPATQEIGELLKLIPESANAALYKIRLWIAKQKLIEDATLDLVTSKFKDIDPKKIVPPEPHIAIPAMQAMSYCMDNNELRELYSNLIASSMNSDKKDFVHPAFVEIIKQLSPLDAINLKLIFSKKSCPVVNYFVQSDDHIESVYYKKYVFLDNNKYFNDVDACSVSITNLFRLSLIDIDFTRQINDTLYDKFLSHPVFTELKTLCDKAKLTNETLTANSCYIYETVDGLPIANLNVPSIEKGFIQLTPLGKSFTEICIN